METENRKGGFTVGFPRLYTVYWNSASTCALTIGLNLGWLTDQKNITESSRLDQDMVFYAMAVPWAYFCGRGMHEFGPYRTMVVAVSASVLAGVVAPACPCSAAVCLYASRALQGLASASLAVSVPIFVAESAKGLYQHAMLCLVEVFTLMGILISHSLNLLVNGNATMNVLMTAVASLNVCSLILIRMKSRDNQWKTCRQHDRTPSPHVGFPDDPAAPDQKNAFAVLLTNTKHRKNICISIGLFVFRDFCGIHLFTKCIRRAFNEINTVPISYGQCTLLVTLFQLIFTIATVFMAEVYGKRKLMLISSLGMLLSATSLQIIVWNSNFITTTGYTSYLCLLIVFIAYILFVAHGLSAMPLAIVRNIATGLTISVHFLFLYIVEFSDINEEHVYTEDSIAVYWFIFVCILQILFVYHCIFEKKKMVYLE